MPFFFSLARTFESGSQEAEDGVVSLTISFTKPFAEFFSLSPLLSLYFLKENAVTERDNYNFTELEIETATWLFRIPPVMNKTAGWFTGWTWLILIIKNKFGHWYVNRPERWSVMPPSPKAQVSRKLKNIPDIGIQNHWGFKMCRNENFRLAYMLPMPKGLSMDLLV